MIILWTKYGAETFEKHIEYIFSKSPTGANNVKWAILDAVNKLEHSPRIGRPGRWEGTRELSVSDYSYIITYQINGDFVEILYIHHTRKQWPPVSGK